MAVPITLTCECGVRHAASLGETVQCECGRRFDTSGLPRGSLSGVYRAQLRMRLYTTFGLIVVAGTTVVTAFLWGFKGLALGLPLAALVWFRLLGPLLRSRVFRGAGELPRWSLEAERATTEK